MEIKEIVKSPDPKARMLKTIMSSAQTEKIRRLFSEDKLDLLMTGKFANSSEAIEVQMSKRVSYKAPIALRLANKIIEDGFTVSLEQGIQMELAFLPEIFSTKDAYEGLTSILQKKRPVYKGQ